MKNSILNRLIEFGLIYEMRDWKSHFTNGTKGMPKTEEPILKYVENLLKKFFENDQEKITNNPLAPWLVMSIKQIGPQNINTNKLNQFKNVIEYFKKSGNAAFLSAKRNADGTFEVTPLDQADKYASDKLAIITKKEEEKKEMEKPVSASPGEEKEEKGDSIPLNRDETDGRIKRVWQANDGSQRMWVQVIDNSWLSTKCPASYAQGRTWGVECQGRNYISGEYINFDLIGPPRGLVRAPSATIAGIAFLKSEERIAEVKQEGNQFIGSQSTSGGWDDADEQVINFIAYSPAMKQLKNLQGIMSSVLERLNKDKADLVQRLLDARPDLVQLNEPLLVKVLGQDWFDLRNVDIEELAKNNPVKFLQSFDRWSRLFGRKAFAQIPLLNFDLLIKKYPDLINDSIGILVGNISPELFDSIIKKIDMDEYILTKTENFKKFIKNMANFPQYKTMFKDLVFNKSDLLIKAFGDKGVGIFKLLQFAREPRLPQHQSATRDAMTGEYIGQRDVIANPEAPIEERIMKKVKFVVPDDLKVMPIKERRDFINKNKELIKSFINADEKGKEIGFLRFVLSESNSQDVERTLGKEKQEFIEYYNQKFKTGEKKNVQVPDRDGILKAKSISYMPGIFEFYSALNKNKPDYLQVGVESFTSVSRYHHGNYDDDAEESRTMYYFPIKVEEAKQNMPEIIKYYYDIRLQANADSKPQPRINDLNPNLKKAYEQEKNLFEYKIRYLTVKDFMKTMNISGAKPEEMIDFYVNTFKPNTAQMAQFFVNNLRFFLEREDVVKALAKISPLLTQLGANNLINKALNDIAVSRYEVQPGEMIEYIDKEAFDPNGPKPYVNDSNANYGQVNLLHGRKYKVLNVRMVNGIENGEVLIMDEGFRDYATKEIKEDPKEVWLGSFMFKVKKVNIVPTLEGGQQIMKLNEMMLRKFVQKRLKIVTQKIEENNRVRQNDKVKVKKPQINRYTAIVLDEKSKERLKVFIKEMQSAKRFIIPSDWNLSCDHVTINPGPPLDKSIIGQTSNIKVLTFAYDENIIAIGVKADIDTEFEKEIPHITIAYSNGTSPVMSNYLTNWKPVPKSFMLSGTVKMIEEVLT